MGEFNIDNYWHIHYKLNGKGGCKQQQKMVDRNLRYRGKREGLSWKRKGVDINSTFACLTIGPEPLREEAVNHQASLGRRNGYLTG